MPRDIELFFEHYRDAFNRLDGDAVTSHYATPCMISHAEGQSVFADAASILHNNRALCDAYRARGYRAASFTARGFLAQNESFCLADIGWTIDCGHEQDTFSTTYQLAKRDGVWKIVHVTAYSEARPQRPATTHV